MLHLLGEKFDNSLCRQYPYDHDTNEAITDFDKAECKNCKDAYVKRTENLSFSRVAAMDYEVPYEFITFLLEDGRIVVINVLNLSGPGVWRRVLWELELNRGKDLDHLIPGLARDILIGPWHY